MARQKATQEETAEAVPVKAPAKKPNSTKVAFEFPEGTDPKVIEQVMANIGKMTQEQVKASEGVDEGRQKYIEESKRRYRCRVNSLRPGWDHFELILSHPDTDQPIPCRGRCGVILEEGLTMYAIQRLRESHDFRLEKGRSLTIDQILATETALVLEKKAVKQRHYDVEIFEEIENPKAFGTIGQVVGNV